MGGEGGWRDEATATATTTTTTTTDQVWGEDEAIR
jgi:hypothetical protein